MVGPRDLRTGYPGIFPQASQSSIGMTGKYPGVVEWLAWRVSSVKVLTLLQPF